MARYKQINVADVKPGQQVRLTLRHPDGWATEVYEGKVVQVHKETRSGIVSGNPITKVTAIEGVGDRIYKFAPSPSGWEITTIESALPPLPSTLGSVVLKDGRTAVLRGQVDEPDGVWVWSDNGEETGLVLGDAEVIYKAPR